MKKLIIAMLLLFLVTGCTQNKKEEIKPTPQEKIGEVVWAFPSSIRGQNIKVLAADVKPLEQIWTLEKTGYPQEWNYAASEEGFVIGDVGYKGVPAYIPNAFAYDSESSLAITTFKGEPIKEIENATLFYDPAAGFGVSSSYYLSGLYRSLEAKPGIIGKADKDYTLYYDGKLITGIPVLEDGNDYSKGVEVTKEMLLGRNAYALSTDETNNTVYFYDAEMKQTGQLILNENQDVVDYTNGFLTIVQDDKYAFYDVANGKYITEFLFTNYIPFSEEYAGVCIDGKWGLINKQGDFVTALLWDSISNAYNGTVAVEYSGYIGILDVMRSQQNNADITTINCYGSENKEEIIARLSQYPVTETDSELKIKIPDNIAPTEELVKIGTVVYTESNVNIRKQPSKSSERVSVMTSPATYDVYDVVEADGFTWYKIGQDQWISNNGQWAEYTPE